MRETEEAMLSELGRLSGSDGFWIGKEFAIGCGMRGMLAVMTTFEVLNRCGR